MSLLRKRRRKWNYLTRIGAVIAIVTFSTELLFVTYRMHLTSSEFQAAKNPQEIHHAIERGTHQVDLAMRLKLVGYAVALPFVILGRLKSRRDEKAQQNAF